MPSMSWASINQTMAKRADPSSTATKAAIPTKTPEAVKACKANDRSRFGEGPVAELVTCDE